MQIGETELDMVKRHVVQGKLIVENQRLLIAKLTSESECTAEMENLLKLFEETQRLHEEHLARLEQR